MNQFFSDVGRELLGLLPAVPAVLWAISFHEFCHGYVALKCGDRTAELEGRLTLNPLAHFDPWGALCMLLFHFGWAKPVPIDPRNFRNPRRDILFAFVVVNLNFAVFNLLPVPPLDGSKLLYYFLPPRPIAVMEWLERWGSLVLLVLIYTGAAGAVMSPVVRWALELIVG